jgi:hypothetical protein
MKHPFGHMTAAVMKAQAAKVLAEREIAENAALFEEVRPLLVQIQNLADHGGTMISIQFGMLENPQKIRSFLESELKYVVTDKTDSTWEINWG